MKEEELKEEWDRYKMIEERDGISDMTINERAIIKAELKGIKEGRQSKLKEVLGMIDKLSITQKEGCPVTIKAGTRFIFTEELKKELTGVKGK